MRLSNLPGRIATHTGLRHLLFLVSALFSILLIGYHFGTFDQVVHIPFMKAEADPSLYPGDALVALRNTRVLAHHFHGDGEGPLHRSARHDGAR